MALDLPHRHAAGVKADDLIVEAVKTRLALADQSRLEGAGAIARNLDLDFAIFGQHRFGAHPVAAVAAAPPRRVAPLVTKIIISSAPSARSISAFFSRRNSPSSPVKSSGLS